MKKIKNEAAVSLGLSRETNNSIPSNFLPLYLLPSRNGGKTGLKLQMDHKNNFRKLITNCL